MNVAGYQDLLAEVKSQITEISADDAAARLSSDEPPVLIDVREPDEFDQGAIDGSVHIPRGFLESRIGGIAPDLSTPIILSCQSGARSAFGARSLEELGYEDVTSLAGGFGGWKQAGLPWSAPRVLNEAQRARYSRHTLIPEVG
jgi:sulfur-carrier protein adenylyltransferase/sulfurtransferase